MATAEKLLELGVLWQRGENQPAHPDAEPLAFKYIQGPGDLRRNPLAVMVAVFSLPELYRRDFEAPREEQFAVKRDRQQPSPGGKRQHRGRLVRGFEQRRDVALRHFRDVYDLEGNARILKQGDSLLHDLVAGSDGIHGPRRPFGVSLRTHFEYIDRCVVDVIFELILDPPTDCSLELVCRNLGRFHQQYLVVRGFKERRAGKTGESVLLRLPLQRTLLLSRGAGNTPPARRKGSFAVARSHVGEFDRLRLDCDGQKA